MKFRDVYRFYIYLILLFLVLVVMQHFSHLYLKHYDYLIFINDALAPIPPIVLVVVFVFGRVAEARAQNSQKKQLVFIKSTLFRLELRDLYIADFLALKSPAITFAKIHAATLPELKDMRRAAESVEYTSLEAMEPVIMQYVATQDVWRRFMDIARQNGFEGIFQDMLSILHFVSDVTTYKELNPDKLFSRHAAGDPALMQRVVRILGDGIRKYLDYAIELKEKQPELFDQLLADYEMSVRARGSATGEAVDGAASEKAATPQLGDAIAGPA
jgi:hypothetical protein